MVWERVQLVHLEQLINSKCLLCLLIGCMYPSLSTTRSTLEIKVKYQSADADGGRPRRHLRLQWVVSRRSAAAQTTLKYSTIDGQRSRRLTGPPRLATHDAAHIASSAVAWRAVVRKSLRMERLSRNVNFMLAQPELSPRCYSSSSSSRNEYYLSGIIALLLQDHRTMSTKSVCSSQYMVTD